MKIRNRPWRLATRAKTGTRAKARETSREFEKENFNLDSGEAGRAYLHIIKGPLPTEVEAMRVSGESIKCFPCSHSSFGICCWWKQLSALGALVQYHHPYVHIIPLGIGYKQKKRSILYRMDHNVLFWNHKQRSQTLP